MFYSPLEVNFKGSRLEEIQLGGGASIPAAAQKPDERQAFGKITKI